MESPKLLEGLKCLLEREEDSGTHSEAEILKELEMSNRV